MAAVLNSPFGPIILERAVVTIGSASDNLLVVSNYSVSSHHAEIRPEEKSVTDLGSAFGTFVNNQRLDWNIPYPLNPGDTILIGEIKFTYEMGETPQQSMTGNVVSQNTFPTFYGQSQAPLSLHDAHTAYGLDLPEAYQQPIYPASSSLERIPLQPLYVPQPGTMTGVPPEEASAVNQGLTRRSRRRLWIPVGIVGVLLLASVLVYFFVVRSTPDKTLDAFCNSMQKGDYQAAYSQFSPALQKMQSEPQFQSENKVTSCTHDSSAQAGSTATAHLTTISSGIKSSGQVSLVQDNNSNWKISSLPSTPSITLDAFCNGIKIRDYQAVYNQLSARVRGQNSESDFATGLAQSGIASCIHGTPTVSSTTATGSMTFYSSTGQSAVYIVTLIKEGNTWKIDDLTSGS